MDWKTIFRDVLISATGSWVIAIIYGSLNSEPILPLAISGWIILFVTLLFLESQRIIVTFTNAPQHFIVHGEKIKFKKFKFDKISDELDETGETIINKKDWRLSFDFKPIRTADYISNIRFRKGSTHASGQIKYSIETGDTKHIEKIFNIQDYPDDQYSYIDCKFNPSDNTSVKIIIEPLDKNSNIDKVIYFDRLEVYEIRTNHDEVHIQFLNKIFGGTLFAIGVVLSPLTWWNDIFINLPISFFFAQILKQINSELFVVSFILFYWITNLVGFMLMHYGGKITFNRQNTENKYLEFLLVSLLYTLAIFILVQFEFILTPLDYLYNQK